MYFFFSPSIASLAAVALAIFMFGPFPLYSPQCTLRVHWILPSSRVFAFLEKTKKKTRKSAKLNRATTAVLCNLSQYLPISRDNVDDFMLCHTILALYTCTCPCFWKDLPHSAIISLKTAPAIHRCCSWQKCTLLRSKIINTFGAVSQRCMRGESTNHQKS